MLEEGAKNQKSQDQLNIGQDLAGGPELTAIKAGTIGPSSAIDDLNEMQIGSVLLNSDEQRGANIVSEYTTSVEHTQLGRLLLSRFQLERIQLYHSQRKHANFEHSSGALLTVTLQKWSVFYDMKLFKVKL